MATTAERVIVALTRAKLRGRFSAIDNNPATPGEVVLWDGGSGIPVYTVREALAEARKDAAAVSLGRKGGKAKSRAKTDAARANGKLGGRPKMTK